ncbi:hypothetical protein [Polymorphospora sp. NPDC050346]|uniref:hypothetical protein n=1 Tax=Polymorphospora sp. NPDC050346 TaxID=3155780 RepID=UPI0033FDE65A
MPEYESFPLWRQSPGGAVNLDPLSLPISPELAQGLIRWATEYDRTWRRDDPAASGFPDPAAEERFHLEGERLASRLATELHGTCAVEYTDGLDHQSRRDHTATGSSSPYLLAMAAAGIPAPPATGAASDPLVHHPRPA